MALSHSPKIATDGLVLYYDQANTKKSWKGAPSDNIFKTANNATNIYHQSHKPFSGINHGSLATSTEVDPPKRDLTVYRIDDDAVDTQNCRYSFRIDCSTSLIDYDSDYVWSSFIYLPSAYAGRWIGTFQAQLYQNTTGTDWHGTRGYNETFDFYGAGSITSANSGIDITKLDQWQRVWIKFKPLAANVNLPENAGNDDNKWAAGYMRADISDGINAGTPFHLYMAGGQLEKSTFVTPFMQEDRTNTQAIIDLTKNSTITTGSAITYNSDNTYEHAPSNDNSTISIPLNTAFNKLIGSINMWIYPNAYSGSNGLFVNRDSSVVNALDWLWLGSYNNGSILYFRIGDGIVCCTNQVTLSSWSTNYAPVSVWTNLCATWESGVGMKLFVNGVLQGQRVAATTWPDTNPTANGTIGLGHASAATGSWNGKIEATAIYDRALTNDEVKQNFEAIRSRFGI